MFRLSRLCDAAATNDEPADQKHGHPVAKNARTGPERAGSDDGQEQDPHSGELQSSTNVIEEHVVRRSGFCVLSSCSAFGSGSRAAFGSGANPEPRTGNPERPRRKSQILWKFLSISRRDSLSMTGRP